MPFHSELSKLRQLLRHLWSFSPIWSRFKFYVRNFSTSHVRTWYQTIQVIGLSSWKSGCLRKISSNFEKHDHILLLWHGNGWDEGIYLLLFSVRESIQESLGFSPFELVFGHTAHWPLKLLKEKNLSDDDSSLNLLQYVSDLKKKTIKSLWSCSVQS